MNAYLYEALRTPRGRGRAGGALAQVAPLDLVSGLLHALALRMPGLAGCADDLILGCVTPVGEQGANLARTAVLHAGWDRRVPGMQVNRFCASGLEAVLLAGYQVTAEAADVVIAGGVESMSRVPMGSDGGPLLSDSAIQAEIGFVPQGIAADLLATLGGFTRDELDRCALLSHQRAARATAEGAFRSLVPVVAQDGTIVLAQDEAIRGGTSLEALAALPAAFAQMGAERFDAVALAKYPQAGEVRHLHTAGNSSAIVDGAALVVIGDREAAARLGRPPRARIVAGAVVGSEPTLMLDGPAPATQAALGRARMTIADIDLIECNEAFAAVVTAFLRAIDLDDLAAVNVNGGAIAMGHPLGATGAILLGTLVDELERRDLATGLVTLCAAGGMGSALIIERV